MIMRLSFESLFFPLLKKKEGQTVALNTTPFVASFTSFLRKKVAKSPWVRTDSEIRIF